MERVLRLLLLLLLWLWVPAAYSAQPTATSKCLWGCRAHNTDFTMQSQPPTASPTSIPDDRPSTSNTTSSGTTFSGKANTGVDFLVAAFFLIAAGWLVLALIYSVLVLFVVRLRARGQLDVYDENFGRLYLLGTRCYIPLGCVLRRYVIALTRERDDDPVRLMTREERRLAMELLLASDDEEHGPQNEESASRSEHGDEEASETTSQDDGHTDQMSVHSCEQKVEEELECDDRNDSDESKEEEEHSVDGISVEEQVCPICLGEYDSSDACFTSTVCPHRYHHSCIMEWLERRANTECPCCRTPLISDEEVWETVQNMRRERRRQLRKTGRGRGICCWRRQSTLQSEDETVEPTPPSSPSNLASFESMGDRDTNEGDVELAGSRGVLFEP